MPDVKYAFRCKTCGHLVHSSHAGENRCPHACSCCGAGVSFGDGQKLEDMLAAASQGAAPDIEQIRRLMSNPTKNIHPDNWEVLADASTERLAELGLTAEQVEQHEPMHRHEGLRQDAERIQAAHGQLERKHAEWTEHKDEWIAEWHVLDRRLQEIDRLLPDASAFDHAPLQNERSQVRQKMQALEDREPTDRDKAHMSHLKSRSDQHKAELAGGPMKSVAPKSVFMRGDDGSTTSEQSGSSFVKKE